MEVLGTWQLEKVCGKFFPAVNLASLFILAKPRLAYAMCVYN